MVYAPQHYIMLQNDDKYTLSWSHKRREIKHIRMHYWKMISFSVVMILITGYICHWLFTYNSTAHCVEFLTYWHARLASAQQTIEWTSLQYYHPIELKKRNETACHTTMIAVLICFHLRMQKASVFIVCVCVILSKCLCGEEPDVPMSVLLTQCSLFFLKNILLSFICSSDMHLSF